MVLSAILFRGLAFLVIVVALGLATAVRGAEEAAMQRITFPTQFIVSLGITIPFTGAEPVSQSGIIYFDGENDCVRIDNYWMGNTRTLIANLRTGSMYTLSNGACVTTAVAGKLLPYGIHANAAADPDPHIVRSVPVSHYSMISVVDDSRVIEEFYVRQVNLTVRDEGGEQVSSYWIPWRLTSRRARGVKEISPPPPKIPNWRYFGEPLMDEIVKYIPQSTALASILQDVDVTTDFFNFAPIVPHWSIFQPPKQCDGPPADTFWEDLAIHDVHRLLTGLSFNTVEGERLMSQLWGDGGRKSGSSSGSGDEL